MRTPALMALLLASSAALSAPPPQPAPGVLTKKKMQETALALVNKLDADRAMQRQTNLMIEQQVASLSDIPCAQSAIPEVRRLMSDALNPTAMRGEAANIYASTFTLDELEWLVNFYDTPLGKKWLTVQPRIMETMSNSSTARLKEAEPKISAALATATKDTRCQMQQQRGR